MARFDNVKDVHMAVVMNAVITSVNVAVLTAAMTGRVATVDEVGASAGLIALADGYCGMLPARESERLSVEADRLARADWTDVLATRNRRSN